jgi:hypothetical protein
MTGSTKRWWQFLLVALAVQASHAAALLAQSHPETGTGSSANIDLGPLGKKALAKFELESLHVTLDELAKAKVTAAHAIYQARADRYLAGKEILDRLLEASIRLLQAELDLQGDEADRLAFRERCWQLSMEAERVNRMRIEGGSVATQDLAQARFVRLDAELDLLQALSKQPGPPGLPGSDFAQVSPLDSKQLARDKFEATRADSDGLRQARVAAAREHFLARMQRYVAGKEILYILIESSLDLLKAERLADAGLASQLAAYERHWASMKQIETICQKKIEGGSGDISSFLMARYRRLEAELWLRQAKAPEISLAVMAADVAENPDAQQLSPKALARARIDATGIPAELARAKLQTAEEYMRSLFQRYMAGRPVTFDDFLWANVQMLQAKLDLSSSPDERREAYEMHWGQMVEADELDTARAQSLGISKNLEMTIARLEAEMWLVRLRRGPGRKPR